MGGRVTRLCPPLFGSSCVRNERSPHGIVALGQTAVDFLVVWFYVFAVD